MAKKTPKTDVATAGTAAVSSDVRTADTAAASPDVRTADNAAVSADVRTEEFTQDETQLAAALGLDLWASSDVRTERAIQSYNSATRHMIEAGLLLKSIRVEVGAESFAAVVEERGMSKRRAYELMRGAALVARLPDAERQRVMALSKSKVVLLADASPAVVEAALDDEEVDISLLTARALRDRIRELEASTTDLAVQRDTAEAEAQGLRKQMKRVPDRADGVPLVVADLRAEIMALGKKAALALESFNSLGVELVQLAGTDSAHDWADATLRLALSQLLALRLDMDGLVARYLREVPGGDPSPVPASYLTRDEVLEAARMYQQLTQTHTYEAALREWEREQARPRDKGRPKAKPVPPKGGEA